MCNGIIYYIKIDKSKWHSLKCNVSRFLKSYSVNPETESVRFCAKRIECKITDSCFLIFRADDGKNISFISIWQSNPSSYTGISSKFKIIEGFPSKLNFDIHFYNLLKVIADALKLNIEEYGNFESELQRTEDSKSESGEGSILYYRGNRFKYSTGRHCNQTNFKKEGIRVGRYQVNISIRSSKVFGCKE